MSFDITAALDDALAARGSSRCSLGRFLDSIPEDTEGRDRLIRLVETPFDRTGNSDTRSATRMASALCKLGFKTTQSPVLDHRNHDCACYR
jgi:hypothetical protein